MAFTTLISTAALASHLDDPAFAIIDCRYKLDDATLGRARACGGAHPGCRVRRPRTRPRRSQEWDERPPSVARSAHACTDLQPARHRQRRAGGRLRPGQRHVRQPAVVAAALARARRGRGARRRVREMDRRGAADGRAAPSRASRAQFTGAPRAEMAVDVDQVASQLVGTREWQLVDARAPERYRGDDGADRQDARAHSRRGESFLPVGISTSTGCSARPRSCARG